jgi:hypothetical protein
VSMRDSLINGPVVWDYLVENGIQGMAFDHLDHAGFLFDEAEDMIVEEIGSVVSRDVGVEILGAADECEGWGGVAKGILEEVRGLREWELSGDAWGTGIVAQRIIDCW